jgi:predicted RNA-binding Zn ribbon-like protein
MKNLAIDLANSLRWTADGSPVDRLDDGAWLRDYAARLADALDWAAPASEKLRARLRALRPVVRAQLETLAARTGRAPDAMLATINRLIGGTPVACRLVRAGRQVMRDERPAAKGGEMLAPLLGLELAELLTEHEPQRVKVCPNPLCRWVYYDATRGNIQRWCCYTCGNRDKVQRYRARQGRRRPRLGV